MVRRDGEGSRRRVDGIPEARGGGSCRLARGARSRAEGRKVEETLGEAPAGGWRRLGVGSELDVRILGRW